jgi:hypothetical protein
MSDIDTELTDQTETQESKTHFADGFPKWTAALPKELQKDERVKGFNSPGEIVYSYFGLQDKMSKLPSAPETADGYEFPAADEKAKTKPDPSTEKWFRDTAYSLKLPKTATEKLYVEYNKVAAERIEAQEKAIAEQARKNDEIIHGEWGADYDTNMKLAEKGIKSAGGDELETYLTERGIRNDPVILKVFKQIGFEHSEDTLRSGTISGGSGKHTLDDEYPSMKDLPDRR